MKTPRLLTILAIVLAQTVVAVPALLNAQDKSAADALASRSRYSDYKFKYGSMRAKLVTETKGEDGRDYSVIETPSGGLWKLDTRRVIKNVQGGTDLIKRYLERLSTVDAKSSTDHMGMAEWLKTEKATSKLNDEYEFHLREVVRLDPTNSRAWTALGYREFEGVWQKPEHKWNTHGYVKSRRGLVPKMTDSRMAMRDEYEKSVSDEKGNFKKWKRLLRKNDPSIMGTELRRMMSPSLLPTVIKAAQSEKSPGLRRMYVEAIGEIASPTAQRALIFFAVKDADLSIQDRAVTLLKQKSFNQASAAATIANELLVSKQRSDVLRGAEVISALGESNVVLPLVQALNTTHEIRNPNAAPPGSTQAGFDRTGSVNSFSQGGDQPAVIPIRFKNEPVLMALRKLTDADFGYDESSWRSWYTDTHTVQEYDLRGDD